ncbi:MAG: HEAT repeat domain-containing protein [Gammaproteobacteria bacterium]|nr:HEAT repeat domain-containing protein [Gammaproteobacteria bacterium]NIR97337.1 HEAT repeat domain-containing protein [Gammaproteobacteria bacterium]NIT63380.1 HEAT repeat domain-containing protein [Gammaproteobacteria bacterium]NIV20307.1 HEAT repeat domain-containing protein [Gammaproteobacteria bacterium]NIX10724.1 HEAT repeat domain-containing protein [Gammaproteobacteria bacterium]
MSDPASQVTPPDALMLLAPGCTHCPKVLEVLGRLIEDGAIGRLEVVNIAVHPERAAQLGARSAPWTRVGPFVLEGMHSDAELRTWARRSGNEEGVRVYLEAQLTAGRIDLARALIQGDTRHLAALLPLVAEPETPMQARVGAGALFEEWEGTPALQALIPRLAELSAHDDRRVRADACHYLGLAGSPRALPYLQARLDDERPEVREIARDSLDRLRGGAAG